MQRFWFFLLVVFLLSACSSVPYGKRRLATTAGSPATRHFRPSAGFPNFVDHSVGREEISIQAMSLVGKPYVWGGNTPDSGFDCSGLVRYVVKQAANVNLPRTTAHMSTSGEAIKPDQIAAGDLVFFNTSGRPHSHVGIYVGKLRFVNAPSAGGIIRLDSLTSPYWAQRFDGIRRIAPPQMEPTPFETPLYQTNSHTTPQSQTASLPPITMPPSAARTAANTPPTQPAPTNSATLSTQEAMANNAQNSVDPIARFARDGD